MELQHHGVKGMKWGVRRYRNEDGSLTAAGKRRYSEDENGKVKRIKSEHRIHLEDKYQEQGMSKETAEMAANRRIKTEKVIAAVAGLTVAAAATYFVTKEVQDRADHIIKSGTILQRISQNPNENLGNRPFYAAYNKKDKIRYEGMLGRQHFNGVNVHKMELGSVGDVKVVSRKKAADVFADLYEHDPEFRRAFRASNERFKGGFGPAANAVNVAARKMSPRELRKQGYDAFNLGLVNHDSNGSVASKKFYDKLKSMGYDAVMDINDKKFSGYNAKAPVIVFNGSKIKVSQVKKLDDAHIDKAYAAAQKMMLGEATTKALAKDGAKWAAIIMGTGAASSAAKTSVVNSYRKEHPDSRMTDKEIYEMLNKEVNKR